MTLTLPLSTVDVAFCVGLLLGVVLTALIFRFWRSPPTAQAEDADLKLPLVAPEAQKYEVGDLKMVLLVRNDLSMQKGKIAAQCGHAVLGAYKDALRRKNPYLAPWETIGQKKIALKVQSEEQLLDFDARAKAAGLVSYPVRDAGHTQVAPHTLTVCALGPAPTAAFDGIGCGDLKLL
eukprot:gnl/TRDRNA2_/TRDRNA2_189394_c0_seq1.p1 gnl/TRDRNA2_/TRDRNA2_189394_c0~~gnl/TRDRNA2_/TRDRNA2_189394_c0_seq1.p1  ORF type:complete len:178 (-),score=34.75 gnl/TRDRNA2_/TRDRNA2_189394_c0_seq1:103-636(-)